MEFTESKLEQLFTQLSLQEGFLFYQHINLSE